MEYQGKEPNSFGRIEFKHEAIKRAMRRTGERPEGLIWQRRRGPVCTSQAKIENSDGTSDHYRRCKGNRAYIQSFRGKANASSDYIRLVMRVHRKKQNGHCAKREYAQKGNRGGGQCFCKTTVMTKTRPLPRKKKALRGLQRVCQNSHGGVSLGRVFNMIAEGHAVGEGSERGRKNRGDKKGSLGVGGIGCKTVLT